MTGRKTIYLIRHGETEFNKLGIVQGSGVDSELNDMGRKQANAFFEHYKHIPFDKVYTSALQRTYQSVQRFIENLQLPHEKLAALNEIQWGDYEGLPARPSWKQEYAEMVSEWANGNLEYRVPNGENPLELQERQKPALDYIMQKEHEQTVLVCMHGRAMKSFLCLMTETHLCEMERFPHQNLGLYILEYNGKTFDIIRQNCGEHIQMQLS